jgi:hypothetical protein
MIRLLGLAPALLLLALSGGSPALARDFDLLVGFRTVVAGLIRDEGYRCPDVKSLTEIGVEPDASIALVVCGPLGRDGAGRSFRVLFHPDNAVSVKPVAR